MYKMGLLTGNRTKSANVVGQTMRLNPHGDMAIYETMVRLSRGYEALLTPFVDSKGNFGKAYSRDMAFAASRYTEVKLDPICSELFSDIDRDAVDFVPNYDNTMKEPTLLPTTFPNVLVSANTGIDVYKRQAFPFGIIHGEHMISKIFAEAEMLLVRLFLEHFAADYLKIFHASSSNDNELLTKMCIRDSYNCVT